MLCNRKYFFRNVKFGVLTAVSMTSFWNVTSCIPVNTHGIIPHKMVLFYYLVSCIPVFNPVHGYSVNLTIIFCLLLLTLDRQRNQIFVALCSDIPTVQ
jgi:hypothetical protein